MGGHRTKPAIVSLVYTEVGAGLFRTSEESLLEVVRPSLFPVLRRLRLAGTILLVLLAPVQKIQQPLRLVLDLRFTLLTIDLSANVSSKEAT